MTLSEWLVTYGFAAAALGLIGVFAGLWIKRRERPRAVWWIILFAGLPLLWRGREAAVHERELCLHAPSCRQQGRCTPELTWADGAMTTQCIATSLGDCQRSVHCRSFGQCSPLDGRCAIVQDSDCTAACRVSGRCTARDGACVATAEGCAASEACAADGLCEPAEDKKSCQASASGCASSTKCKRLGYCTAEGGRCAATAEGCAASAVCKARGHCQLREGVCRK